MKVLALASYPIQAAATRYRLEQYAGPLAERGIEMTIRPFLDPRLFENLYHRSALTTNAIGLLASGVRRLKDVVAARAVDVVLVQREAMMFGPPLVEWLIARVLACPMVLDLDDATYVSYTSPTYGGIGKALKWFGKTDDLIRWANIVVCGNDAIAAYVANKGARARIVPTIVDTEIFCPGLKDRRNEKLVLGWIGTHSTYPYLESIFPVIQQLSSDHSIRLKIVGSGRKEISIPGVEVENLEWKLEREVKDFQSFDIGLYPIVSSLYPEEWATGKSGFKAIQYMAVGIPYVASPVGAIKEIGEAGKTHFCASTNEEWQTALLELISDQKKREQMGKAGRSTAVAQYGLAAQADKLAAALREAVEGS